MENKAVEKKRMSWKEEEITAMLAIMQDININKLLDGKKLRNLKVYEMVQSSLKEKNILKTAVQIRVKYKHLKTEYFKIKRNNSVSGAAKTECSYWDSLDKLLSSRPVLVGASSFGVDSQSDSDLMPLEGEYSVNEDGALEYVDDILGESDSENLEPLPSTSTYEETPRRTNYNKTHLESQMSQLPGPSTSHEDTRGRLNEKTPSRAYSKSMSAFCSEWKKMQEELQSKLLLEQQKIINEEMAKQREWEEKFLTEERERSENFLRELLANLKEPNTKTNPFL